MAASGRPTPLPERSGRPRFRDLQPSEVRNRDANPYLEQHFAFGRPLLPASEAWKWHGRWNEWFAREAPLVLEIGCGNGYFLTELAQRHADHNVVGVEIRYKRTVRCAKKLKAAGLNNGAMCRYHAAYLDDLFADGSLSAIYVNHPDPWPKERHEKNRLISRWFLEDVVRLLVPGGMFRLKSDFHDNIGRVAGLLDGLPLTITGQTFDLDTDGAPWPDDIETYYQRKMRGKGETIAAIELVRA